MKPNKSFLTRILVLALTFAILSSLFAGCNSVLVTPVTVAGQRSATDSNSASASASVAEEEATAPVSTEAVDEEDEISAFSAEEIFSISYPLTEEIQTLSFTATLFPNIAELISDHNDNPYFIYLEEQTGIHIDWRLISGAVKDEQYRLLFAAEDYTDLIFEMLSTYTGGGAAAIENDVIYDLAPLLEENAPDYYALISNAENEDVRKYITLDDGSIAAVWGFSDIVAPLGGTTVRKDWLDDLGEDIPVTYDDWTRVLTAFKNEKNADSALFLLPTFNNGGIDELADGFGVKSTWYAVDGEVRYGAAEEEFLRYITLLNSWYEDGLISTDFASYSDLSDANALVTNNRTGLLRAGANDYKNLTEAATDEDFHLVGIRKPVENEDDTLHFGDTRMINKAVSITTAAEDPELALQWLNYIYTEEGIITSNYGVEGNAFEYDEDGNPYYTDLIKNNPDGLSEQQARWLYCGTALPLYSVEERNFDSYSEEGLTAITETWLDGVDSGYVYHGDLTAEEAEEFNSIYSDIETYVEENILSFIIGNRDLAEYPEFLETLNGMGLDRALELKQAAFDRYAAR